MCAIMFGYENSLWQIKGFMPSFVWIGATVYLWWVPNAAPGGMTIQIPLFGGIVAMQPRRSTCYVGGDHHPPSTHSL